MLRWPDNPVRISLDFLRALDAHEPGTWYGQRKLDGRLRLIDKQNGYIWRAKDRPSAQDVPAALKAEFESLPWPEHIGVAAEWIGPRVAGQAHAIYVFDLLSTATDAETQWLGSMPFALRYHILKEITRAMPPSPNVHIIKRVSNPGLVSFYEECKADPLCEGIVVRAAEHRHQGAFDKCRDAKSGFFKCKWR